MYIYLIITGKWYKYYDPDDLRTAYLNDHKDIISILLQAGANPDSSYIGRNPLLYDACLEGKEEIVNIFLNAGANPNVKKESGETPLMISANKGHVNIVKVLIKHGADIEAQLNPPSLLNALAMAVRSDNSNKLSVIKLLLQYGADVTKKFSIAKIGISELTLNEELKNFLALTTIYRNENLINISDILDKRLCSFLEWKLSIKPYDIEFKFNYNGLKKIDRVKGSFVS